VVANATSFIGVENATRSNSATVCPLVMYPKFPPLEEDGHFECIVAKPSNVSASPSSKVWNSESNAFPGSVASTRMCETFTAPSWLTFDDSDDEDTEKVRRRMREDVDGLADAERSLLKAEEYALANLICCCFRRGKK
jgi:hypothetical protein